MEGRKVLIVEDDPQLRESLIAGLEASGFQTVAVADGTSALERLSGTSFDVVCLDVILPELSGYEICEQIRQSTRHQSTRIVMMSARAYPADFANALDAGADAFLAKPFSLKSLVETIERAVSRRDQHAVA